MYVYCMRTTLVQTSAVWLTPLRFALQKIGQYNFLNILASLWKGELSGSRLALSQTRRTLVSHTRKCISLPIRVRIIFFHFLLSSTNFLFTNNVFSQNYFGIPAVWNSLDPNILQRLACLYWFTAHFVVWVLQTHPPNPRDQTIFLLYFHSQKLQIRGITCSEHGQLSRTNISA